MGLNTWSAGCLSNHRCCLCLYGRESMDCILTAWRLNLPESRGKLAVSEKCTGLLHSRTAPGIGNRPNGLSIKNWEGFAKQGWVLWNWRSWMGNVHLCPAPVDLCSATRCSDPIWEPSLREGGSEGFIQGTSSPASCSVQGPEELAHPEP